MNSKKHLSRGKILGYSATNEDRIKHPDIAIAINTLTSGGHLLGKAARNPGYILIHTSRYDEFGKTLKYCFLISEDRLTEEQIQGAEIAAIHESENLVLVGRGKIK